MFDYMPFRFLRLVSMKEKLRALLITAKVLQFCADIFALFGVFLFGFIYFKHYSDNPFSALRDPTFIVTILIPFIPAAALAWAASRKRRQIRTILEQNEKK
jgi:hypothetical protein